MARARALERALAALGSDAEVARTHGMTRPGLSQYLAIVRRLPGDLLDAAEKEGDHTRLRRLSLRSLLAIAREEGKGTRRSMLRELLA